MLNVNLFVVMTIVVIARFNAAARLDTMTDSDAFTFAPRSAPSLMVLTDFDAPTPAAALQKLQRDNVWNISASALRIVMYCPPSPTSSVRCSSTSTGVTGKATVVVETAVGFPSPASGGVSISVDQLFGYERTAGVASAFNDGTSASVIGVVVIIVLIIVAVIGVCICRKKFADRASERGPNAPVSSSSRRRRQVPNLATPPRQTVTYAPVPRPGSTSSVIRPAATEPTPSYSEEMRSVGPTIIAPVIPSVRAASESALTATREATSAVRQSVLSVDYAARTAATTLQTLPSPPNLAAVVPSTSLFSADVTPASAGGVVSLDQLGY